MLQYDIELSFLYLGRLAIIYNIFFEFQNKDDETALHSAAQYGHTAVVSLLLEYACDPGIRNCRGETALDLAAQYGR